MALRELIEKCKKKDIEAQSMLYELFSGKVYSICLKYSPNATEAQDNLQDTFLTAFKSIGQFRHKGSFEGWLKRIAVNTVLQKYRKARYFELIDEERIADENEEINAEADVPLAFLLQIIQELPDRYRLVFNLYVLDGYSHREVADMMDISEGTSKSNLARARRILMSKIEEFRTHRQAVPGAVQGL